MGKSTRQKLTRELTEVMTQKELTDIYRTFHPNTHTHTKYTLSEPHETFSKTEHILGNKGNVNRYKKIRIISCILSDDHGN